jgi:hypothetical protein
MALQAASLSNGIISTLSSTQLSKSSFVLHFSHHFLLIVAIQYMTAGTKGKSNYFTWAYQEHQHKNWDCQSC